MVESYQRIVLVCSSVSNCYAYHAWHSRVGPALAKINFYDPYAKGAVEDASLIASLVMLRKMHDFLSGKKNKPDDLICSEFGLPTCVLMNEKEREDVNKRIAHLTDKTEFDEDFNRDLLVLYRRIHPIFETMLQELLKTFGGHAKNQFEIQQTANFICEMNREMEKSIERGY